MCPGMPGRGRVYDATGGARPNRSDAPSARGVGRCPQAGLPARVVHTRPGRDHGRAGAGQGRRHGPHRPARPRPGRPRAGAGRPRPSGCAAAPGGRLGRAGRTADAVLRPFAPPPPAAPWLPGHRGVDLAVAPGDAGPRGRCRASSPSPGRWPARAVVGGRPRRRPADDVRARGRRRPGRRAGAGRRPGRVGSPPGPHATRGARVRAAPGCLHWGMLRDRATSTRSPSPGSEPAAPSSGCCRRRTGAAAADLAGWSAAGAQSRASADRARRRGLRHPAVTDRAGPPPLPASRRPRWPVLRRQPGWRSGDGGVPCSRRRAVRRLAACRSRRRPGRPRPLRAGVGHAAEAVDLDARGRVLLLDRPDGRPATLWPYSQVLHAAVLVGAPARRARSRCCRSPTGCEPYRLGSAFQRHPRRGSRRAGTYDDNAWVGLAASQPALLSRSGRPERGHRTAPARAGPRGTQVPSGGVRWREGSRGAARVLDRGASACWPCGRRTPRPQALEVAHSAARTFLLGPLRRAGRPGRRTTSTPAATSDPTVWSYNQGLAVGLLTCCCTAPGRRRRSPRAQALAHADRRALRRGRPAVARTAVLRRRCWVGCSCCCTRPTATRAGSPSSTATWTGCASRTGSVGVTGRPASAPTTASARWTWPA